jgi:mRNA interferase MazF
VRRGEIFQCDFGDPVNPEQGFRRPAMVISVDPFHRSGLAVVLPITSTKRPVPTAVEVEGAGLDRTSYIQVDQIRTLSQKRLTRQLGVVDGVTLIRIEQVLGRLLGLVAQASSERPSRQ